MMMMIVISIVISCDNIGGGVVVVVVVLLLLLMMIVCYDDGCLFVGCLTFQQHASVSQGRICSDNFTRCHAEIEDQTFHLTQSQYTDSVTPCARQGSHCNDGDDDIDRDGDDYCDKYRGDDNDGGGDDDDDNIFNSYVAASAEAPTADTESLLMTMMIR